MGQKSRSKKNRKPVASKGSGQNRQAAKTVMPDSLRGGVSAANVASRSVSSMDVQTDYVRSDIVRILLLLVVVGILIGILHLVGVKTDYLARGGHKLTQFLQLQ